MDALQSPPESGSVPLPNGCTLYWKEGVMGRFYYSDEVGGGVNVWDPTVVCQSTLLAAIVQEETFRKIESEITRRKERA